MKRRRSIPGADYDPLHLFFKVFEVYEVACEVMLAGSQKIQVAVAKEVKRRVLCSQLSSGLQRKVDGSPDSCIVSGADISPSLRGRRGVWLEGQVLGA